MDQARSVDTERLRRDIDETRACITRTVGELKQKAGESMRWQTYVEQYPAPILVGATVLGLVVGRRLARRLPSDHHAWDGGAGMDASLGRPPSGGRAARFAGVSASWQKVGSRVEALANRVIDEVADAAERIIVPALVSGVESFLDGRRGAPGPSESRRTAYS